jgi:DNA-binding NarL/FixJ family response regulator
MPGMSEPLSALIIDDDQHIRMFLSTLLKLAGVDKVLEAATGPEGLEAFFLHKPTITLLDLSMPGRTGLEILALIMKTNPGAVVIVCTSINEHNIVLECERLGATGFLLKTRRKEDLLAALKEFLKKASAAREGG